MNRNQIKSTSSQIRNRLLDLLLDMTQLISSAPMRYVPVGDYLRTMDDLSQRVSDLSTLSASLDEALNPASVPPPRDPPPDNPPPRDPPPSDDLPPWDPPPVTGFPTDFSSLPPIDFKMPDPPQATSPFSQGQKYDWLPVQYDLPGVFEGHAFSGTQAWGGAMLAMVNSNRSSAFEDIPAQCSDRRLVCDSAFDPASNVNGPLWLIRRYNAQGVIRNLLAWRVGNFHKGREGHVVYLNPAREVLLENVIGIQHGGQLLQAVWRGEEVGAAKLETLIPRDQYPDMIPGLTFKIRNCGSIDGGLINFGVSVRASWPFSFFSPGHEILDVDGAFVYCNHPRGFVGPNGNVYRSHGAFLIGGGSFYRTKRAYLKNIDFNCVAPDREMMKLSEVDEVYILSGRIRAYASAGGGVDPNLNVITVFDDVKRLEISDNVDFDGWVKVYAKPYVLLSSVRHRPGNRTVIVN